MNTFKRRSRQLQAEIRSNSDRVWGEQEQSMSEDGFDGNEMQCSYCGKWIYADSPRCPKCGNNTDDLGPLKKSEKEGRIIPRIFVIAGWLVVLCFLLPLLIALILWFRACK
jgi:hypothetical protein